MLLKVIGAIMIIGGTTIVGMSARAGLGRREFVFRELGQALEYMHTEISYALTPTDEILKELSDMLKAPLSFFFKTCLDEHKRRPDMPIAMIWNRALRDAEYLGLSAQEKSVFEELGNAFGRYDAEEQLHVIAHVRRICESNLKSASDSKIKLGKLYGGLSVISGIAVVIILL